MKRDIQALFVAVLIVAVNLRKIEQFTAAERAPAERPRKPRRRDRLGNYERLPDEVATDPPAA